MRLPALAVLLAALLTPAAPAAAPVERDVVYGHAAGTALRMDVHRPATRPLEGAPAIVWVHGGGFHSGTRAHMEAFARFFARRGWLVANIDYRLRPRAEIRTIGYAAGSATAQADAETAIRYLRRHAGALGVDRRRIAIAGYSAGAITALNVAGRARGAARVQAAAAIAGFGPAGDFDAADPPMLLLHGTADRAVPFGAAAETCRAATRAGARCDLVRYAGVGHGLPRERFAEVAGGIARWLGRTGLSPR